MSNRWSWLLAILALTALGACGANPGSGPDATPQEAAAAAYQAGPPYSLTLYTMINNRSDSGAHTSLMINAPSQQVVFDPAGSVRFSSVPEIGDVLYGITPQVKRMYESAHARETYRVRIQEIIVPAATAEMALRLVQANGTVAPAACTSSTSGILTRLPGFETLRRVMFPTKLSDQFARLPGVTTRELRESDSDDKTAAIRLMETGATQ